MTDDQTFKAALDALDVLSGRDVERASAHVVDYYRHRYSNPGKVEVLWRPQWTEEELEKLRSPGPDFIHFNRTG